MNVYECKKSGSNYALYYVLLHLVRIDKFDLNVDFERGWVMQIISQIDIKLKDMEEANDNSSLNSKELI